MCKNDIFIFLILFCPFIFRVSMPSTKEKCMKETTSGVKDKDMGSIHMLMAQFLKVSTHLK